MADKMEFDPAGFFIIFIDKEAGEIVVEHYLNVPKKGAKVATGKLNRVLRGKDPEAMCREIARLKLVSRPDHAAYVGRELQRAAAALKKGARYEQD